MADEPQQALSDQALALMRCPVTRSKVRQEGELLVAEQPDRAGLRYPIKEGIPVLLAEEAILPEGIESMEACKAKYADVIDSTI